MDELELVEFVDRVEKDFRGRPVRYSAPIGSMSEREADIANMELARRGSETTVIALDACNVDYTLDR